MNSGMKQIFNLLHRDGYNPRWSENGEIEVTIEGGLYAIRHQPGDEQFFQLAYPNFWLAQGMLSIPKIVEACNEATSSTKVAKLISIGDRVHAVAEAFVESPIDFYKHFRRYVSAINHAVSVFLQQMNSTKTS